MCSNLEKGHINEYIMGLTLKKTLEYWSDTRQTPVYRPDTRQTIVYW